MSQALATIEPTRLPTLDEWTRERIDLIKRTYCKGATDDELALFVSVCKRTGLSPEANQIYAVKRKDQMTIQTSIDGLRLIAERHGQWAGGGPAEWCGPDGQWVDVWLQKENPAAARFSVRRHDWQVPRTAVVLWTEFHNSSSPMWKQMPALMLAKCAEASALRASFPAELSGLYTSEEMGQADNEPKSARATVRAEIADPTVKNLIADLNALTDPAKRTAAKAEFVQRFGEPKDLKPEQYEEAKKFVASKLGF